MRLKELENLESKDDEFEVETLQAKAEDDVYDEAVAYNQKKDEEEKQ